MRLQIALLILFSHLYLPAAITQEVDSFSFQEAEKELAQLAYTIVNDSLLEDRQTAYQTFDSLLTITLQQPNSYAYPFKEVQSVSIQVAPDNTFRIFTWQLFIDNNTYQYGGLIQMNRKEAALFPLQDASAEIPIYDLEYETLSPARWYGAVYYNIRAFDSLDQKKYLLFGFDGFEFFHKRKVVEVLSFDAEKNPVFGAPIFVKQVEGYPPTTKNRLFLEYSAEMSVRLNYDEQLGILIYDHLIQIQGRYKGQGMANVPDGSYEGYYYADGLWNYKEKIFDLISEEPPRPKPILGIEKRSLFGDKIAEKKKKTNLVKKIK